MLNIIIKPDQGGQYTITATTRDIAKWERTTKGASFSQLENDRKITDIYKIAFYAATRNGMFDGTLAEFEQSVDLDFEDEEEGEPDPTPSAV